MPETTRYHRIGRVFSLIIKADNFDIVFFFLLCQLTVKIKLTDPNRQMLGRPKVIAHEANGFPLDNYGRYLYDHIVPGMQVHTFYSKNLQYSYSNRNRPCQVGPIEVMGQTYDYDQVDAFIQ